MNTPPLDALRAVLDRPGVVAASLFGSRARGAERAGSDLDVALWLHPKLDPDARLGLVLALDRAAAAAVPTVAVDIVVLNDAPLPVRHRAIRDGRRLVDHEPLTRMRLETQALIAYLDTVPLRAELARGQDARLADGRFGRP